MKYNPPYSSVGNQQFFGCVHWVALCFLLSFFTHCAQIVAPTGGVKDSKLPVVQNENPKSKTISFRSEKFTIKFDEYIQLKDPEEQIVVSPPLDTKPEFIISKRSLDIKLTSKLKENTTYTFNFGNSITDNHEGNILANYTYVLSTGLVIDTLEIKGKIKDAYTNKDQKGFIVGLYNPSGFVDSTVFLTKPLYFTKTGEDGSFVIKNLPLERYHLFAFKDENKNLKYDQNELVAFYSTPVNTSDAGIQKTLLAYKPYLYPTNKLVDIISKDIGKHQFVFYNPLGVNIKPNQGGIYTTDFKKGKDLIDTFIVYSKDWGYDSVAFKIQTPQYDTLVYAKAKKSAKINKLEMVLPKSLELNDTLKIVFNQPVSLLHKDTGYVQLKEDSIIINPQLTMSNTKKALNVYYPWNEKKTYSVILRDSMFRDIYGHYSKTEKVSITTKALKDYSSLTLTVNYDGSGQQYIIQIKNEDESKVCYEFIVAQNLVIPIEYILPGKYKIKIIKDLNKNNLWDNGSFILNKQPESVYYHPEILNLRAYWDLEQTIDLIKLVN